MELTAEALYKLIGEKSAPDDEVRILAEDGYTYKIISVQREEIAHTNGIFWIKIEEA